jgi:hypothetical protein
MSLTQPVPAAYDRYRHYKGGEYIVLATATHTETKEIMVVYLSLTYGSVWTRPLSIWNEIIPDLNDPEKSVCRFLRISR